MKTSYYSNNKVAPQQSHDLKGSIAEDKKFIKLFKTGKVNVEEVIDHEFSLSQAEKVYEIFNDKKIIV